jgi:glucokinase
MTKVGSIGLDVGGTKTLCALFDESFNVVEETKVKTLDSPGAQAFSDMLTESLTELIRKADKANLTVANIGVGLAGSLNSDGTVKDCPNIPFLEHGFSFRTLVTKATGANVITMNDCDAGLYGEHRLGAAVGYQHVIGVFLGTAIGGALIIDGKLYRGASGKAGNIGHYLLHPLGPLAGSERHGILDDFSSRAALAGEAATMAAKKWAPYLAKAVGTDVRNISAKRLAEAIANGDEKIEELVRSRSHIVGIVLSNLVDFLNPEMVVLGGGLSEAIPALIRDEVEAAIHTHSTEEATHDLKIVIAGLKRHSVAAGAAQFAVDASSVVKS